MSKDNVPASDITKNPSYLKTPEEQYLNPNANEIAPLVAPLADEAYELVFENRNNAGIVLGQNPKTSNNRRSSWEKLQHANPH